jgi:hypothetical protein
METGPGQGKQGTFSRKSFLEVALLTLFMLIGLGLLGYFVGHHEWKRAIDALFVAGTWILVVFIASEVAWRRARESGSGPHAPQAAPDVYKVTRPSNAGHAYEFNVTRIKEQAQAPSLSSDRMASHWCYLAFSFGISGTIASLTCVAQSSERRATTLIASDGASLLVERAECETPVYIDRNYAIKCGDVDGSLTDQYILRMPNDDKINPRFFVSFEIDRPIEVIVYHDKRAELPGWLTEKAGFTRTEKSLTLQNDPQAKYEGFARTFDTCVELGANTEHGGCLAGSTGQDCSMYWIALSHADIRAVSYHCGEPATRRMPPSLEQVAGDPAMRAMFQDVFLARQGPHIVQTDTGSRMDLKCAETHPAFASICAPMRTRLDTRYDCKEPAARKANGAAAHSPTSYRLSALSRPKADLTRLALEHWEFTDVDLAGSEMSAASLPDARFILSNLSHVNLSNADLSDATILGSDLRGAVLVGTNLRDVDFSGSDLAGAVFEPDCLPALGGLVQARGLRDLAYKHNPEALVRLREALKAAGLDQQFRHVSAAIEHGRTVRAVFIERALREVVFHWPTDYGDDPHRPIALVLYLAAVFYVIYLGCILSARYPMELLERKSGKEAPTRKYIDRYHKRAIWCALLVAKNSLPIGIGGLLVSDWIGKFLFSDYDFVLTGWFRFWTGVHSFIASSLFAIWLFSYVSVSFH